MPTTGEINAPRARRNPIYTTDTDGAEIVLVPLANHPEPAKLLKEDFERLLADGVSDQWTFNLAGYGYSYVRCGANRSGRLDIISRLIMRPRRGQCVRYKDRNNLNLRRDNLTFKARKQIREPAAASVVKKRPPQDPKKVEAAAALVRVFLETGKIPNARKLLAATSTISRDINHE